MQIKRLRNTHFGTKKISRVVTGWALYEPGNTVYPMRWQESTAEHFGCWRLL